MITAKNSYIRQGLRPVDPALADRMRAMVTLRTDQALNATLGISYNTWRKVVAGQPIRASVASRLERRLEDTVSTAAR